MEIAVITNTNRFERLIWNLTYLIFIKFTPNIFFRYRVLFLKLFGANVDWSARVYPKCNIFLPRNLILGKNSTISNYVDVYNVAPIIIGENTVISSKCSLITASKNYKGNRELLLSSIFIGNNVWLAYDVFVAPGVKIESDSTILARVSLFKNVSGGSIVKYGI